MMKSGNLSYVRWITIYEVSKKGMERKGNKAHVIIFLEDDQKRTFTEHEKQPKKNRRGIGQP